MRQLLNFHPTSTASSDGCREYARVVGGLNKRGFLFQPPVLKRGLLPLQENGVNEGGPPVTAYGSIGEANDDLWVFQ